MEGKHRALSATATGLAPYNVLAITAIYNGIANGHCAQPVFRLLHSTPNRGEVRRLDQEVELQSRTISQSQIAS